MPKITSFTIFPRSATDSVTLSTASTAFLAGDIKLFTFSDNSENPLPRALLKKALRASETFEIISPKKLERLVHNCLPCSKSPIIISQVSAQPD